MWVHVVNMKDWQLLCEFGIYYSYYCVQLKLKFKFVNDSMYSVEEVKSVISSQTDLYMNL
jgi:hypothetical protein